MGRYYTRASKLGGLFEIAKRQGRDLAPLLERVGLDASLERHPEAAIDYDPVCRLLKLCAQEWDMPDIGLQMVRYQRIDFLGPVALVARTEPTVGAALSAIIDNIIVHSNAVTVVLEEVGDTASIIVNPRDDAPRSRENTESMLAQAKLALEGVAGGPVPLSGVEINDEAPISVRAITSHFVCPVRFGAERAAVSFPRQVLAQNVEQSDLAYREIFRRYLASERAEQCLNFRDEVRAEIARQMELGQCTLASVAERLNVAPRSLQRRLQAEGSSFRGLVEDWRRARAHTLVTRTRLPLSEVSQALGYADQSVFTQAFHRWFGASPKRIRTQFA